VQFFRVPLVLPYTYAEKKISENQYMPKRIYSKFKDFKTDLGTVDGLLRFDENFKLKLEPKKIAAPTPPKEDKAPSEYPVLNVKRNSNQRKYRLWM
jgi:DNA topoisomerase-3